MKNLHFRYFVTILLTNCKHIGQFIGYTVLKIAGCGYIEMDGNTEEILAYEGIASGTLTVSKSDEVYTVKGVFTTLSGKILEVDCTSEAIVYSDYSQNGGIAPLSVKNSTAKLNKTFSSAMKFMKK